MHYRTLGRTGLKVSLLSQGTGGPSQFGQNKGLFQAEQNRLIRRCLDLGINLFDTHESYGESEAILVVRLRASHAATTYLSPSGPTRVTATLPATPRNSPARSNAASAV